MAIKDKYKFVFVVHEGGELGYAEYLKLAAQKKGWEARIYNVTLQGKEREIVDFDPDFIILANFVDPYIGKYLQAHRSKKYLFNFLPLQVYEGIFMTEPRMPSENVKYDMSQLLEISDAVLSAAPELDYYRLEFERMKKPYFEGIVIYPLVLKLENDPIEAKTITWGGVGGRDALRFSDRYKEFIQLLSKEVPIKVYGPYRNFSYLPPHIYDGHIMFGMDNIKTIRDNGIYLLTHSWFHFLGNSIPGMRIFEAAAANAVVISDKLPFAIEHFGDSFLYFDQNADAAVMAKQVADHYAWIKANPEKAKAMAAKAHQIFLDKFTLETDLIRIAKMHEYIIAREKKDGLSHTFVY